MGTVDEVVRVAIQQGVLTSQQGGREGELRCEMCLCSLTGWAPAAEHLKGESHAKVLRRGPQEISYSPSTGLRFGSLPTDIQAAMDEDIFRQFTKDGHIAFHCNLCQLQMTGTAPASSHLRGDKHKKRLLRGLALQPTTSLPVPATFLNGAAPVTAPHEASLEEELKRGTIEKVWKMGALEYTCKICNATMSGETPTLGHLMGKAHKKKACSRMELGMNLRAPLASTSLATETPFLGDATPFGSVAFPRLQTCNNQLLASFSELDTSQTTDVMAALRSGILKEVKPELFVCQVCTGGIMCGKPPALAHLRGGPHAKALARSNLRPSSVLPVSSSTPIISAASKLRDLDLSFNSLSSLSTSSSTASHSRNASDAAPIDPSLEESPDHPMKAALLSGILVPCSQEIGFYECTVCNKVITSKQSAIEHLNGASHSKAARARLMQSLELSRRSRSCSTSSSGSYASISDSSLPQRDAVETAYEAGIVDKLAQKCKVCRVMFSSRTELTNHLSCETHLTTLKREATKTPTEVVVKSTSAILSAMPVEDGQLDMMECVRTGEVEVLMRGNLESYRCVPCQKEVCGHISLRSHLLGRAHETAKKKLHVEVEPVAPAQVAAPVPNEQSDDFKALKLDDDNAIILIEENETPGTHPGYLALLAKNTTKIYTK